MELRDYQNKQLEFLNSMVSPKRNQLFKNNCSLESCTGSGKSIVMLQFIKNYFDSHTGRDKIFISTGFNKLVFQIYKTAVSMGINTKILIGKNNCVCAKKFKGLPEEIFYEDCPYTATSKECSSCNMRNSYECFYNLQVDDIQTSGKTLIITNHSTLIVKNDFFLKNTIGGFIDECQSFGDFYEAALKIEVPYSELNNIAKFIEKDFVTSQNNTLISVYKWGLTRGVLKRDTLKNVISMRTSKKDKNGRPLTVGNFFPRAADGISSWCNVVNDASVYIHPQIEDGRHIGLMIDRFFMRVNLGLNVCLVSATVDSYTKSIFNLKGSNNSYVEKNCKIIDYSKSNMIIYQEFNENNLNRYIKAQKGNHGLILSTRLDIIQELIRIGSIQDYEIIDNQESFVDGKKQILVGSKSLFQGIDIPDIEFICINRIPFQRYDESYKKKMYYFESNGHSPYTYYTIPSTTNALIQSMGRLWRKAGDRGNIALFDGRALTKHRNILNEALSYRDGIRLLSY